MNANAQINPGARAGRIGLMGGTFNPVHTGHLFIAWEAKNKFSLDCVYFVPASIPPHKEKGSLPDEEDRYRMVLLAVESNPCFIASRMELDRGGKSYSIDTVRRFREMLGKNAEIYFIIGSDSCDEFNTWKDSKQLLKECVFLVAPRTGSAKQAKGRKSRRGFIFMDSPVLEISSTYIRKKLALQESVKYLVPEAVEKYIAEHKLYAGPA